MVQTFSTNSILYIVYLERIHTCTQELTLNCFFPLSLNNTIAAFSISKSYRIFAKTLCYSLYYKAGWKHVLILKFRFPGEFVVLTFLFIYNIHVVKRTDLKGPAQWTLTKLTHSCNNQWDRFRKSPAPQKVHLLLHSVITSPTGNHYSDLHHQWLISSAFELQINGTRKCGFPLQH